MTYLALTRTSSMAGRKTIGLHDSAKGARLVLAIPRQSPIKKVFVMINYINIFIIHNPTAQEG